jgi:hypothetical protein
VHAGLVLLCALLAGAPVVGCGVSSRRSADVPAHVVTYDDDCALQQYFDERRAAGLRPPKPVEERVANDEKGEASGEGAYRIGDPLARRRLARLLRDEYSGIDTRTIEAVEGGDAEVLVRVLWHNTGPVRRLRAEAKVVLEVGGAATELPTNSCLGDLLFGDRLYELRARYLRNEVDLGIGRVHAEP